MRRLKNSRVLVAVCFIGCGSKGEALLDVGASDASSVDSSPSALDSGVSIDSASDTSQSDASASHATKDCKPTLDPVISVWPTPAVKPGACTDDQIDQFWMDCLSTGGETTDCNLFESHWPDCVRCLVAPAEAEPTAVYGDVTIGGGADHTMKANQVGCMLTLAVTDSEKACASALADELMCHANVCDKQCADSTSWAKCTTASDADLCKATVEKGHAACSDWSKPGSLYDRCWDKDGWTKYRKIARVLCGSPIVDAGSGG